MRKEDQGRDRYYQKKYGITLADYNGMLAQQNNCCAICKRNQSEFQTRLHVDHDHAWRKANIEYLKDKNSVWQATANYLGDKFLACGVTKSQARREIWQDLKKRSVRGLLCWQDNAAIAKFRDNPERMASAAEYIKRHQNAN